MSFPSAGAALLVALGAGLPAGGLRHPAAWTLAAAALWGCASRGPLPAPPGTRFWLAWLGWCLVSAAACPEPLRSLGAVGQAATAVLALALAAAWNEADRRRWAWGLLAAGPAFAGAAWLIRRPGLPMTGLLPPYYNYTACLEAAALGAAVAALASGRLPPAWRWLPWLTAAAAAAEILACGSRGAALAAAAAAPWALWRAGRRRLLAAAAAAAAILATALLPQLRRQALKPGIPGANMRPEIWASAVAVANDGPLLGEGPGRFDRGFLRHNFGSTLGAARFALRSTHAHSEPLQAAAETGWAGLALLLAALWATLASGPARPRTWTQEAALAAAAALAAQSVVDNVLALPALQLGLASALGAAVAREPRAGADAPARDKRAGTAEVEAAAEPVALPAGAAWRTLCLGAVLLAAWGRWPDWLLRRSLDRARAAPPAEALRLVRGAARLAPRDADLLETEARAALRSDPPAPLAAGEALAKAAALSPYNAVYAQMLAELAASRRDWPLALRWARRAAALEPEFLQARLVAAETLARLGRDAEARAEALALAAAAKRAEGRPEAINEYEWLVTRKDALRLRELLERLGLDDASAGEKG
ncbi:MAG: O-antigen ligase family protein [Elusimicrobia bacterium]|nr:O-antigen ligase family protein [Elusimicrobiota bacterium]